MRSTPAAAGSLTAEPDRFSEQAWDLLLASQQQQHRADQLNAIRQ